jgi:hypothetical protein
MADWSASVARGWRGKGRLPEEVVRLFEEHDEKGSPFLLCVETRSAADPDAPPVREDLPAREGSEDVFHAVWQFLWRLTDDRYHSVSVMFVNFRPREPLAAGASRPTGFTRRAGSLLEGLRQFSYCVSGSLRPSARGSVCEWAMLSCTRQTDEAGTDS